MENLIYTSSLDSILQFISNQRRSYKINIDCKDFVRYYDSLDVSINHYVLNTVFIKHTEITPIYKVLRKGNDINIVKVIIPSFTVFFPQFNNIKYTFNKTSINLLIQNNKFAIEYDDIIEFFDNGISNFLKRTLASILSKKYYSSCGRSLLCPDYSLWVKGHSY